MEEQPSINNNNRHSRDESLNIKPGDVLYGKGKEIFNHPGNAKFREVIGSQISAYVKCKNSHERLSLVEVVIDVIESNAGGRFLRKNHITGNWIHMNPRQIHDKVMNAFRDATKKITSSSSHNSTTSSMAGKGSTSLSLAEQPNEHCARSGKRERETTTVLVDHQSTQGRLQQQQITDPYVTLSSAMFPQSAELRQQEFSAGVLPLNVLSSFDRTNLPVAIFYLPPAQNITTQANTSMSLPFQNGSLQYRLPSTEPIPTVQLSESSLLEQYQLLQQLEKKG